jgi:hypothetical protein
VAVDALMREELDNLKAAVEGEKKKKGKGGKKGKKSKKAKGKKGKKGKKDKDLTADRTPESLYKELVQEGIVKRVSPVSMNQFIGQYSHLVGDDVIRHPADFIVPLRHVVILAAGWLMN